jgi:hypothetical protein
MSGLSALPRGFGRKRQFGKARHLCTFSVKSTLACPTYWPDGEMRSGDKSDPQYWLTHWEADWRELLWMPVRGA